jgi:hypothetical protein
MTASGLPELPTIFRLRRDPHQRWAAAMTELALRGRIPRCVLARLNAARARSIELGLTASGRKS